MSLKETLFLARINLDLLFSSRNPVVFTVFWGSLFVNGASFNVEMDVFKDRKFF